MSFYNIEFKKCITPSRNAIEMKSEPDIKENLIHIYYLINKIIIIDSEKHLLDHNHHIFGGILQLECVTF